MQTQTFLETVLSGEGHYCVFGARVETYIDGNGDEQKREIKKQKLYPTIEAVCHAADNLTKEGFNAYFALATFKTAENRKGENAHQMRSFFLDLDCREGKEFPSKQAAIAELRKFCVATKLPRPTLVDSGGGVHVYWPLIEAVDADEWKVVAEQFKALCNLHAFDIDTSVPSDKARVLRVPESFNFKDDPPTPVAILGEPSKPMTFEAFKALMGAIPVTAKNFVPRVMDDVTNALAGSFSNSFKLIVQKTAAGRGCAQIQKIIEEQATLSEPMWRAGLSVAKFCVDGAKAIHKISAGHPDYNPDTTEAKAAQIKGPYTCDKFDEFNPNVCKDCKHRGKFKSPIVLGRVVQEATEADNIVEDVPELHVDVPKQTYVIPKYPEPFFRGKTGGIFKRMKNKEGDPIEVPIYHNDFYVVRRLRDPDVGEAVVMRLHLPKDGVREFTVPLASILSKDEFRKHMAAHGVAVIKMEELMSYTASWVNKLQATTQADEARRQFGWVDEQMSAFVVGSKEIRADRVDHNPPSSSTVRMFPLFQSKGTLDGWKEIADFYNRDGMELHQYILGLSFGSPFMQFVPQCASLFHVYSQDPGLGKTTAMMAGASIWGNPELILLREVDTHASKMNRAELYKNIFLPIDEMTNVHPKEASDFLYQLTGGMQRNRQSQNANMERARGETWHTNACSTGNTSFLGRVRMYKAIPKAEATRVLEYEAQKFHFDTKAETDVLSRNLYAHYGHACIPLMQYVIANMDECRTLFLQTQERIDIAAGLSQPHRFWSVQAASAITGLLVAKRLGLIQYKISDVVTWLIGVIQKAKQEIETMSGTLEDTLTSFLAENYNNILRIKSTDDARNASDALEHLIIPDASPRISLVARYEYDVKKMYLLPKPLREWCNKQQINYQTFVESLKTGQTRAVMKKVRMGKGTNMNLPPSDALVIDCSEFMSDEVEQTLAAAHVSINLPTAVQQADQP
jgi:hypothetical protein